MTAGLRKFPSQESTSWHFMDSARTLLSETMFRHFKMVSCRKLCRHLDSNPIDKRGAAVYRPSTLGMLTHDVDNSPSEVKEPIRKEIDETLQLQGIKS